MPNSVPGVCIKYPWLFKKNEGKNLKYNLC